MWKGGKDVELFLWEKEADNAVEEDDTEQIRAPGGGLIRNEVLSPPIYYVFVGALKIVDDDNFL